MMMEEFGYYDPDVAGEIYGSDDDWEEAPEAISSFWDDMDEPDTEYSTFYMQQLPLYRKLISLLLLGFGQGREFNGHR